MYEEIKGLAERFQNTFKGLMDKVSSLLREIAALQKKMTEILEERLTAATEEQRKEIERAKREMAEQAKKVKEAAERVTDWVNTPGNIANEVCDGVVSAVSTGGEAIMNGGKAVVECFRDFLGCISGRKKRPGCGIPEFNIPEIKEPNLDVSEKFTAILETLKPDLNLLDIDLSGMKGQIDASSLKNIRSRMKALFNNLMNLLKLIARYWSKIFYLTVIAVVVDAIRYQKHYYTDNEFDNKMVDENLKRMWTKNGLRKLTPLRNWEIKKQEAQMSTSLKMTSEELERLVTECFPVILSSVVFLGIVIIDFFFASIISSILVGSEVNDIMKHCLPKPRQTDSYSLGLISAILFVCLLSCVIDAYFNRLRAQICNLFFADIADKRARYLYK